MFMSSLKDQVKLYPSFAAQFISASDSVTVDKSRTHTHTHTHTHTLPEIGFPTRCEDIVHICKLKKHKGGQ